MYVLYMDVGLLIGFKKFYSVFVLLSPPSLLFFLPLPLIPSVFLRSPPPSFSYVLSFYHFPIAPIPVPSLGFYSPSSIFPPVLPFYFFPFFAIPSHFFPILTFSILWYSPPPPHSLSHEFTFYFAVNLQTLCTKHDCT